MDDYGIDDVDDTFDVDDPELDETETEDPYDEYDDETDVETQEDDLEVQEDDVDVQEGAEPKFGSLGTVEFPDGTTVENPKQDALGYVYKDTDDYMAGTDKHEVDDSGVATGTS